MIRRTRCLAALAVGAAATAARAQPAPEADAAVTPYRPTVSTPAALSAPGWLETEAGAQRLESDAAGPRDSMVYSLKLAFSDDWGVRLGGECWVRSQGPNARRISGVGDTSLVLKRRFRMTERSALGLEVGVLAPTAPAGLHAGSGKTDGLVTGIYSADLDAVWHADLNLGTTRLGATGPAEGRDAMLWAAALSRAVGPAWGVVGEYSGLRRSGTDASGQLLLAATYNPQPHLTWDFGVAHRTNAATPKWTLFAGGTFLVAHLF